METIECKYCNEEMELLSGCCQDTCWSEMTMFKGEHVGHGICNTCKEHAYFTANENEDNICDYCSKEKHAADNDKVYDNHACENL